MLTSGRDVIAQVHSGGSRRTGATARSAATVDAVDAKVKAPILPPVEELAEGAEDADDERGLILDELGDRLDAFKALSKNDEAGADALLDGFEVSGKVEKDIVFELSARKPLYLPGRYEEAHRLAMRSLEVLDRNGARPPKLPALGPLQPVASYLVQLVTRFVVRNHQANVVNQIKNLYTRREAQCLPYSTERSMLRRGRIDAEKVAPTLKKNPLGVPTFLLGGAFLSSIISTLGRTAASTTKNKLGLGIAAVVLFLVLLGISWVVLRGSAVARKRIRLTLDKPLKALYETIGACGKPPKDQSWTFALLSILLIIPAAVLLLVGIVWALIV